MVKDVVRSPEDLEYQVSVGSNETVSAPARLQATGQLMDESKLPPTTFRSQSGINLLLGDRIGPQNSSKPPARRPLAGNSKQVLVDRITLLQNQIVTLQQRIADLSRNTSSPLRGKSIKFDEGDDAEGDESVTSSKRVELQLAGTPSSRSTSEHQLVQFPSTFASSSYDDPNNTESEYLEQVVTLAGKLRKGLIKAAAEGKVIGTIMMEKQKEKGREAEVEAEVEMDDAFGTDELRQMLSEATPQPQNADSYANAFAKRNLELYKDPKDRSEMMRPGPLQEKTQHPRYVDILTRCIRETYIAHMGTFDELEFCVWLVTEVTYHTEQTASDEVDLDELDDTRYEFSEKFMKRYPFVGTKQLIIHANIWRHKRGEPPIIQTEEMRNAERFTFAQQEMSKDGTYPTTAIG